MFNRRYSIKKISTISLVNVENETKVRANNKYRVIKYRIKCVHRSEICQGVFCYLNIENEQFKIRSIVRIRAPPTDLNSKKFRLEERSWKADSLKEEKNKYNPYEIYEKDGKYYVSFRNGEKEYKDLEIGKKVYEAFNTFELQDVSHMNVVDRHLEQSEIWDSSLYERVFQKEEGVEDTVLNKLEAERLHSAIQQLSEIQRRRLMKYYFEDKNYEQIAQEEGCSFQMVAKSVKAAIRNLKKILR